MAVDDIALGHEVGAPVHVEDLLPGVVVLGIVGGLVGRFIAASVLKIGSVDGVNLESIVIATLGAIAAVAVVNLAKGGRGLRSGVR